MANNMQTRREYLTTMALSTGVAASGVHGAWGQASGGVKAKIDFIFSDDLGYGNVKMPTP